MDIMRQAVRTNTDAQGIDDVSATAAGGVVAAPVPPGASSESMDVEVTYSNGLNDNGEV